ncbi:TRAP transporter small permease subunit [Stutzerimonas stutzeri]|uniref:TRAP transporter small permease protein n=1 Tax=Stutzerimonas stutzeri TaxID=316 RepID=A0A6I6LNI7_STUST|nr:TRAP transporter small permease subunit [Stutzerimonas stutzeri]QGZ30347.1 TRAP transporter small permease subunit [Stutzerimonas stutzeri]
MRLIHAYINGITRLNNVIGRWTAYLIFVIFLLLIGEVFMRYLFASPTSWTNELGQMLFGLYIVLSGGYVLAQRGHVSVDLLYSSLSRRTQAWLDIFTSIMFFLFVAALLYFGSSMAWESIQSMETSYSAWNPPIWPIKAAIPIAVGLLLLQGVAKLLEDILVALNLEPGLDLPESSKEGQE